MKVKLNVNGTEHEIPSKLWADMPKERKDRYTILSTEDAKPTVETKATNKVEPVKVDNAKKPLPDTGDTDK